MAAKKSSVAQNQLRPFQSYHVFKDPSAAKADWKAFLKTIAADTFKLTDGLEGKFTVTTATSVDQVPQSTDGLRVAWMTYEKEVTPAWADGSTNVVDKENHIILVAAAFKHVAISTSDKALAGRIDRLKPPKVPAANLAGLPRVAPATLESALVGGNARILWMSAIHRDVAIRPNAKVLIGTNLEAALDPLSDQTFHYTSVRSDGPKVFGSAVPGVSPRKGRVWLAPSNTFQDFTTRTRRLLEIIDKAKSTAAPFPLLARPVADLSKVAAAFDYVLLPPESDNGADDKLQKRHALATSVPWTLKGTPTSSAVKLSTKIDGTSYELALTIAKSGASVKVVKPAPPAAGASTAAPALPSEVAAAIERFESDAMTIYYDTGHTYSARAVYEMHTRLVAFDGFKTSAFAKTDIKEEKPTKPSATTKNKSVAALDKIGTAGEQSLFSWVFRTHGKKSWLWCDDGSGEIADFIHVAADDRITLFHLKAADADDGDISVSAYEVVCAQALKNIRMLETRDIVPILRDRVTNPKPYDRCWYDQEPTDENKFVDRVEKIPPSRRRPNVVVVQPHVSLAKLPTTLDLTTHRRVAQLHTMLNGFAANFRNLGIGFEVVIRK